MSTRTAFQRRVWIIKFVLLPIVCLLLAYAGQRFYFAHFASGSASPLQIYLLLLLPLLTFAALDFFCYRYFSRQRVAYMQQMAEQLAEQQTPSDFPELDPLVEIYRAKEQELRRERNKIFWIVQHIPGGLLTIDRDEQITLAACPAFEQLGLPMSGLVGKPVTAFHELLGVPSAHSPLIAALREGVKSRRISLVRDRYFEAVNTPMLNPAGELNGAVCLFVDVTDRVRQEQELKRLERLSLVGQMAASLSHEIRNPLTVIRGFLQLHAERSEHGQSRAQFQLLIGELDRVSQILQGFLAISRSGGGTWSQVSLADLVGQLLPLLTSEASVHGVKLRFDLQDAPALLLNPGDTKQLLLNLYRNALEACETAGVVQISTGSDGQGRQYLKVEDNGCGMSPAVLERLGTPFNSTKENGTGLGLPLCLSVAEEHGAELLFAPAASHGTVVTVLFPAPGELLPRVSND